MSQTIKTLRVTRDNHHVTRKVKLGDRSAGVQCHSVFVQRGRDLLGRADYGNAAAEVKIVVMKHGIQDAGDGTADGQ